MRDVASLFRRRFRLVVGALLPGAGLVLAYGLGIASPGPDALIATHRAGYVFVAFAYAVVELLSRWLSRRQANRAAPTPATPSA